MHPSESVCDVSGFVTLYRADKMPDSLREGVNLWECVLQVVFAKVLLTSIYRARDRINAHGFTHSEQVHGIGIPVSELTGFRYFFPDCRYS